MCYKKIEDDECDFVSFLDGKYKAHNDCCNELTEILDEIDEARRLLILDKRHIKNILTEAVASDDLDYIRGLLKGELEKLN